MVDEDGAIPGLFVGFPGVEEIAHDQDDIPPALGVFVPALGFELEGRIAQPADILWVTEMVAGQAGELLQQGLEVGLVVVNAGEVAIPEGQAGIDLRGQDFEFAAQNPGFGMEQVVEG
jgi:hypothetical protein